MVFALQKPHVALRHAADWFVAGAEGFEPPYGGTKTRCLTAWLRPNMYDSVRERSLCEGPLVAPTCPP